MQLVENDIDPLAPRRVVDRLGVGLDDLELLHDVPTRVNAAALAAGALDDRKDFR